MPERPKNPAVLSRLQRALQTEPAQEAVAGLVNAATWARNVLACWVDGKSSDAWVKGKAEELAHAIGVELAILRELGAEVPDSPSAPPLPAIPALRARGAFGFAVPPAIENPPPPTRRVDLPATFADRGLYLVVDAPSRVPFTVLGLWEGQEQAHEGDEYQDVHLISGWAKGEVRAYVIHGGKLRRQLPCYTGRWPEMDAAVGAALGVEVACG